jgi:hypothetical protein
MIARVVQTLHPLSLVIQIESKTSTIPSRLRYCLLRYDPLFMDSLPLNTRSGRNSVKFAWLSIRGEFDALISTLSISWVVL